MVGAALGGFLAEPARKYPALDSPFLREYPYVFPCIVSSIFCAISGVLSLYFLPETINTRGRRSLSARKASAARSNQLYSRIPTTGPDEEGVEKEPMSDATGAAELLGPLQRRHRRGQSRLARSLSHTHTHVLSLTCAVSVAHTYTCTLFVTHTHICIYIPVYICASYHTDTHVKDRLNHSLVRSPQSHSTCIHKHSQIKLTYPTRTHVLSLPLSLSPLVIQASQQQHGQQMISRTGRAAYLTRMSKARGKMMTMMMMTLTLVQPRPDH